MNILFDQAILFFQRLNHGFGWRNQYDSGKMLKGPADLSSSSYRAKQSPRIKHVSEVFISDDMWSRVRFQLTARWMPYSYQFFSHETFYSFSSSSSSYNDTYVWMTSFNATFIVANYYYYFIFVLIQCSFEYLYYW